MQLLALTYFLSERPLQVFYFVGFTLVSWALGLVRRLQYSRVHCSGGNYVCDVAPIQRKSPTPISLWELDCLYAETAGRKTQRSSTASVSCFPPQNGRSLRGSLPTRQSPPLSGPRKSSRQGIASAVEIGAANIFHSPVEDLPGSDAAPTHRFVG